jgi:hypothetical protein
VDGRLPGSPGKWLHLLLVVVLAFPATVARADTEDYATLIRQGRRLRLDADKARKTAPQTAAALHLEAARRFAAAARRPETAARRAQASQSAARAYAQALALAGGDAAREELAALCEWATGAQVARPAGCPAQASPEAAPADGAAAAAAAARAEDEDSGAASPAVVPRPPGGDTEDSAATVGGDTRAAPRPLVGAAGMSPSRSSGTGPTFDEAPLPAGATGAVRPARARPSVAFVVTLSLAGALGAVALGTGLARVREPFRGAAFNKVHAAAVATWADEDLTNNVPHDGGSDMCARSIDPSVDAACRQHRRLLVASVTTGALAGVLLVTSLVVEGVRRRRGAARDGGPRPAVSRIPGGLVAGLHGRF